jgi:hypothetical protein
MIGMLLSILATDDALRTAASGCRQPVFSDLEITRAVHRWIQQHGDAATARRARWSRRCDAGATARVLTHGCASSWPSARSPPADEQTLIRPSPRWISPPSKYAGPRLVDLLIALCDHARSNQWGVL